MSHIHRWLAAPLVLCVSGISAQQSADPKSFAEPVEAEVRFTDDSVMRMIVLQDRVEVVTRYGKLMVPVREIQSIDFGVHVPEGLEQKIAQSIEDLGSEAYRTRETALKNLVGWGPYAFPQVYHATKSPDPEIIKRSILALDKIRAKHPARNLRLRQEDVIATPAFTIVGNIITPVMRAKNVNFGELDLKLCTLRSVRWLSTSFETEVTIDASRHGSAPNQWMDTGFEARSVGRVLIVASGMVDLWPQPGGGTLYQTTPSGYRGGGGLGQQLPGLLMGRIGEDGPAFAIGERYDAAPTRDGRLYLHIVPSPWQNASVGSYQVRITPKYSLSGGD
jgi:hypothetical protein